MAEHGFYQFFESYFEFLEHRFANVIMKMDDSDDLQTITIEQMKKPIVIFLCLNGLAAIIFIAEILIFRWLKWRNRKRTLIFKLGIHDAKSNMLFSIDPEFSINFQ